MADRTRTLAPEVLAACFAFLDLGELISASHVSWAWRAAALSFPSLWAHIDLDAPYGTSGRPLHLAVSRAGQLPLDFRYLDVYGAPSDSMVEAVGQYFHRFSSFKWTCNIINIDISRPAPLLREFCCYEWTCVIPPDFLGGSAGALRTLHLDNAIFPETCPALSTVTDLRARHPEIADECPRFHLIFDLCPRLEILFLDLNDISRDPGSELPAGPAPRTLRKVMLESWACCDLLQLYAEWGLASVADVHLLMPFDVSFPPSPAIDGVVGLSVLFKRTEEVHIVAQLSGARMRKVTCDDLPDVGYLVPALAEMLQHATMLEHMQTVSVPLGVLDHALAGAYHWPRLAHLTVHIYAHELSDMRRYDQGYPLISWKHLDCLRAAPALESLALHIHGLDDASEPRTIRDAQGLRKYLSALAGCIPRLIRVHGFPKAVVREMRTLDGTEPHVLFC
ncbi:hypothetical protein AURDEDRAFT_171166 [Auricularia subglabra TFB-10046 SS5]|uniref:F-box domain-containing protein n=1 Tax=Auricularia subglabra (strain TFB-10046 / SS5) TaxID=717982 RepID=J0D1K1_AURST|nr:hypothetical protein AURDEDRAFT_171166 [Auricularia subglabra TFB-10046 SS5]